MFTIIATTTEKNTRLTFILKEQKTQVVFEAGQNTNDSY